MTECERNQHKIDNLYEGIEKLFDRIERIEERHDREMEDIERVVDILAKSIGHLQEDIGDIAKWRKGIRILTDQSKKPSKCPICMGDGRLENKKTSMGVTTIFRQCHSCEGKGIVWG